MAQVNFTVSVRSYDKLKKLNLNNLKKNLDEIFEMYECDNILCDGDVGDHEILRINGGVTENNLDDLTEDCQLGDLAESLSKKLGVNVIDCVMCTGKCERVCKCPVVKVKKCYIDDSMLEDGN